MDQKPEEFREETFLNTPRCAFRRVSHGTASCTISTDSYVSEVDPLTCQNCDVPGIVAEPQCRYLSVGTELKPYRGEGRVVVSMACKALNIRLYSLKTCEECSLCSPVPSIVGEITKPATTASININIDDKLVSDLARDIRMDYGVQLDDAPPLSPIRCWRFPEGKCRKFPVYQSRKVTVILRKTDQNDYLYTEAILPALKSLNLNPYRIDEEIEDDEKLCRCCENCQEGSYTLLNLDEWDTNSLMLLGINYGLGRRSALLHSAGAAAPPVLGYMQHDIVEYDNIEMLKQNLIEHFSAYIKPEG
ncbi:MAG: hypothetical protein H7A35_12430 [Planctomycetales bacterium]|nr:hypothetical protein [bacterium]UNM07660.1 MAG: hypothetical protein H7A35_12430 [Planctomycetales bacterium]